MSADERQQAHPRGIGRRGFILGGGALWLAHGWVTPRLQAQSGAAPIKVAQIGTRHAHATGKMQAMRAAPQDWQILGYSEKDSESAQLAGASPTYRGFAFMEESALLATPGLQVVVVETHIDESCAAAVRAIRAGKHVHLDKPGALQHEEFRAMRQEAAQRGVIVQMGYMLRYNPAFEFMFRCVREGWFGDIIEIDASMGKNSDAAERATVKALSGGSMFELGGHPIDAILTVMGSPPVAVEALSTPTRDDGVKDNQLAVLKFARATATVRTQLSDPFGTQRRHFTVSGTKGSIEIRPLESGQVKLSLTSARGAYSAGTHSFEVGPKQGRYDGEFRDLARVIRGEKPFGWTAEHDIAVHATVLKASGLTAT
ncbi:MAG TPA: Gfo/Idh/MocA family oxidoreductase [Opitutaceae bacterium]|nr:Gfo/Idh/MocA family oxidoreductase [Opitutaceae bacterium]